MKINWNWGQKFGKTFVPFVLWVAIASETEIAKIVSNVFALVFFDALQYVWVVADDQIRIFINCQMSQLFRSGIRYIFPFHAPVEIHNDKFCSDFDSAHIRFP